VCVGLCALVLYAAKGASAEPISLLSPVAPLNPPPPLFRGASPIEAQFETRFPGRLRNEERVVVGLEQNGAPASVVVTQRFVIARTGDFFFIVPAPATSVVPAPGSQAQPGHRELGIVWQGFANRRRVLVSTATLSVPEAKTGLPLRVSIVPKGDGAVVILENVARRPVTYVSGSVPLGAVRDAAVRLRDAQRKAGEGAISGILAVEGKPGRQVTTTATAPLRLRGTIAVPGGKPVSVGSVLGNGRPLQRMITLSGREPPQIELHVDLLDPLELLPRPDDLAQARNPLAALQAALASTALSWQFRRYLDSPDALGPSSTTYLYRTLPRHPAARARPERRSGSGDTLAIVLAATLGGAALLGLAVLWARS
jgi:hypothetical protein